MNLLASLLGGLGLFLVGIKAVGANLQQFAGRRMRQVVGRATGNPLSTAATGALMGAVTQSSNAVTFIATSMVQAGMLPLRRAMPIVAFSNVGTAGLVMLATIDTHLAVLWLVALVGFMTAFNLDRRGAFKPVLGTLLGLGLLFLGLDMMKIGSSARDDMHALNAMLEAGGGAALGLALPFLAAAVATVVAQSSSTITILALTLNAAGLLDFEQAASAMYGASLGSGGAVLLLSGSLSGAARRLALHQTIVKCAGALLFLLLLVVEQMTGTPLLLAATGLLAEDADHRLGWLFLLLQLASALVVAPFGPHMERLLTRLSPETAVETLSRPRFLYDQALADAPTALDLVKLEQARLLERLPTLIDPLREEPEGAGPARRELMEAATALERGVGAFLAELLGRGCDRAQMDRAVALEASMASMVALRETLGEFGDSVETCRAQPGAEALLPLLHRLAESLHLLLGQLAELAASGDAEDAAQLRALTSDRGAMMDGLRRRLARSEPTLAYGVQDVLFRATAQFERAVWLTGRQALLLAPQGG